MTQNEQLDLRPHVLIVDDEPDTLSPLKVDLEQWVEAMVVHPSDLTQADITAADLALIDLRIEDWPKRDEVDLISLKPLDGLALAGILRGHADRLKPDSPVAFAIYSAHLLHLSGGLPPVSREHAIARINNLEWAFPKEGANTNVPLARQILSLAFAVRQLPPAWPQNQPEQTREIVSRLLLLPRDESWAERAWEDIEACHPPLYELSKASHGLAFLRWVLHRILPYPCFLWDTHYLAARFRVTYASLKRALDGESELTQSIASFKYEGILSDFLGPRWWRSGVEAFLWDRTNGNPFDASSLHSMLSSFELDPIQDIQPVVCIDQNYRALPELFSIEDVVPIQPDDWPAYADQAWTTAELIVQEPSLRTLMLSSSSKIHE